MYIGGLLSVDGINECWRGVISGRKSIYGLYIHSPTQHKLCLGGEFREYSRAPGTLTNWIPALAFTPYTCPPPPTQPTPSRSSKTNSSQQQSLYRTLTYSALQIVDKLAATPLIHAHIIPHAQGGRGGRGVEIPSSARALYISLFNITLLSYIQLGNFKLCAISIRNALYITQLTQKQTLQFRHSFIIIINVCAAWGILMFIVNPAI